MSAVELLLSRLEKVKRTGHGRWIARCPAHEDHSPSLNVRELDDGRVLMICRAGCPNEDVLAAIGLGFDALYPPRPIERGKPERRPFPAADVLACLEYESLVVLAYAASLSDGWRPSADDRTRLAIAVRRISAARWVAHGS